MSTPDIDLDGLLRWVAPADRIEISADEIRALVALVRDSQHERDECARVGRHLIDVLDHASGYLHQSGEPIHEGDWRACVNAVDRALVVYGKLAHSRIVAERAGRRSWYV